MALNEDEKMAGGLMNAITDRFGREAVDQVVADMPAGQANDAERARQLGEQMRNGK